MCGIRPREVRKQRVSAEKALQRFGSPNISMDLGEHSDGAPAQINYAEPASVLSPDPRHLLDEPRPLPQHLLDSVTANPQFI